MKFTKYPSTTFESIQLNAGIILKTFTPGTDTIDAKDIIGATSGGVNFVATPTYTDYGEDIDNVPKNTMELKRLDQIEATMSGTFATVTPSLGKSLVGAADLDESSGKITPRNDLSTDDFEDLWWVGDYSNLNGEKNGGFCAIHMMHSLSTGGFQIQSGDRAKGQFAFTYTAHYSISEPDIVPFEIYIKAGTAETA